MQSSDFEWFILNMPALYAKYGDCFLAIKDKTILGHYPTYASAVANTKKHEELGTYIVQQCGPDETAYTNYISSFNFSA